MKTEILKVLESVKQNKISNSEALEWLERLKKRDVPEITDSKVTGEFTGILKRTFTYNDEYLKAHVILGKQVLLGVTHCSLAIEAARSIYPEDAVIHIHKFLFRHPVVFDEGDQIEVSVSVQPNGNRRVFNNRFYKPNQKKDIEAASGEYIFGSGFHPETMNISSRIHNYDYLLSQEFLAKNDFLKREPVLQSVQKIWTHKEGNFGEILLSGEAIRSTFPYFIHPAIIDGGFNTGVAAFSKDILLPDEAAGFWVPFMIKDIYVRGPLSGKCYCDSKVKRIDSQTMVMDFAIGDRDGKIKVHIHEFTLKYTKTADFFKSDRNPAFHIPAPQKRVSESDLAGVTPDDGAILHSNGIEVYLTKKVVAILGKRNQKPNINLNFMEMGIDSNDLIKLSRQVEDELGIELYPTIFFEYQNIRELGNYFITEHPKAIAAYFGTPALAGNTDGSIDPVENEFQADLLYPARKEPIVSEASAFHEEYEGDIRDAFFDIGIAPGKRVVTEEDIAVIGMAGRFAGSKDLNELWENIKAGKDLITEVPPNHWDWRPWFDESRDAPNKTYCKWGSFIEVDKFDPVFFGISPLEAAWMDPQARLLLEVIQAMLEEAGYGRRIYGTNTGVYVGACFRDYWEEIVQRQIPIVDYQAGSRFLSSIPARISYIYDLHGESLPVDNACASSLSALHLACMALQSNKCEMAFVAGVNLILNPMHYINFSRSQALSPTGRCHTFDKNADGYVPGEGVGAVLLKPLSRAIRDNDMIHAVIKGSATNHGGHSNNPTSPRLELQSELLFAAWQDAGIDPESLTYIEAHGTGTKLGDPIECEALKKAFHHYTNKQGFCLMGSVKSNLGHLEGAAGIAGIIKTILMLKHKMIPAMPNFEEINPIIDLNNSALRINKTLEEWNPGERVPRRAGVSAFGMTGNNAHVVLEEYRPTLPIRAVDAELSQPNIFVLSAKDEERLNVYANQMLNFIKNKVNIPFDQDYYQGAGEQESGAAKPSFRLEDVCYTLQIGREPMPERLAIIAGSLVELIQKLEKYCLGKTDFTHFFRGNSRNYEDISRLFIEGREGREYLRILLDDRKNYKLAQLWAAGIDVKWEDLYKNPLPKLIVLPTYPFKNERYWLPHKKQAVPNGLLSEARPTPKLAGSYNPYEDPDGRNILLAAAINYLKEVFAEILKLNINQINETAGFDEYGLDSVIINHFHSKLEKEFGKIPATLFFTYKNISSLAKYLTDNHREVIKSRAAVSNVAAAAENIESFTRNVPGHIITESPDLQTVGGEVDAIAIIGMSAQFPHSNNIGEYWENLAAGRDCITEIPLSRWDYRDYYDPDKGKQGITYSKWGAFIADIDFFDPFFFNISPREARLMDPQERLFLQAAWACFEDAGYTRQTLEEPNFGDRRAKVGIFVGASFNNYQLLSMNEWQKGNMIPVISQTFSIANRVSYFFNFGGPSVPIDTACSASLVAMHMACESIRSGESSMALVGGVSLNLHPSEYITMCDAQMLSGSGHCKVFSDEADGIVPGEGICAILLKPLRKAIRDRDHIYAVVKGTAVNNDGKTQGYSVPNPVAQTELVCTALDKARINPRTLTYMEAHGTGTALGDPIEIEGLTGAYRQYTQDKQFCAIGSVKSNIGHLKAAAGLAGLIKVVLQMQHGKLVPSLHTKRLNPRIDFANSPFYVQRQLSDWKQPEFEEDGLIQIYPRRAGVSSFGAGGANAHVILEEYIPTGAKGAASSLLNGTANETMNRDCVEEDVILVLSAQKKESLLDYAGKLKAFLQKHNEDTERISLKNLAYTLQTGREAMPFRLAFIAGTLDQIIEKLRRFTEFPEDMSVRYGLFYHQVNRNEPVRIGIAALQELIQKSELVKIAELWSKGAAIPWENLFTTGRKPSRISLPTYSFAKERYWVSDPAQYPRIPVKSEKAGGLNNKEPQPASLFIRLAGAPESERFGILVSYLQKLVGAVLEFNPLQLPETDQGFYDLGIDSVLATRLCGKIENSLDIALYPTIVFDYPTIFDLASYLLEKIHFTDGAITKDLTPKAMDSIHCEKIYFRAEWSKAKLDVKTENLEIPDSILLFDTDSGLADGLSIKNIRVVLVKPGPSYQKIHCNLYEVNPKNNNDYHNLMEDLKKDDVFPEKIIHYWSKKSFTEAIEGFKEQLEQGIFSIFHLTKKLFGQRHDHFIKLLYLYDVIAVNIQPHYEAVMGFFRSAAMENPKFKYKTVAVDSPCISEIALAELMVDDAPGTAIRYQGKERSRNVFREIGKPGYQQVALKDDGVYLITGGAGAIGMIFAEYIAEKVKAKIILSGRSDLNQPKQERIKQLQKPGVEVAYVKADVGNRRGAEALIAEIKARFHKLDGIIHAAGVIRDSLIINKSIPEIENVFAPKVYGLLNLDDVTKNEELDFFIIFSSSIAVSGNIGQSDYAYANQFMDSLVNFREYLRGKKERTGKTVTINWSNWKDGGMQIDEGILEKLGFSSLLPEDGFEAFEKALQLDTRQIILIKADRSKLDHNFVILPPEDAEVIKADSVVKTDEKLISESESIITRVKEKWRSPDIEYVYHEIAALRQSEVERELEKTLTKLGM
jgi:acyl transferase domain-containing protein/acyl carrier protein